MQICTLQPRLNALCLSCKTWHAKQAQENARLRYSWSIHDLRILFAASAKIFYAPIRITNEAGRDIIVKPSKGNPHGFKMIPRSTMEVTLMSMSTDGTPVSPVMFKAIDAATKTPLEINNSPNDFPVKPRESKNDFTTMVVAVPREYRD